MLSGVRTVTDLSIATPLRKVRTRAARSGAHDATIVRREAPRWLGATRSVARRNTAAWFAPLGGGASRRTRQALPLGDVGPRIRGRSPVRSRVARPSEPLDRTRARPCLWRWRRTGTR